MMVMIFSMVFLMSSQPIVMVISLIFISLIYSFYIYVMMGSFWFSYALMMVMLSGVMVVFMYMVSLMPNEKFEMYMLILVVMVMFLMIKNLYMNNSGDSSFVCINLWLSNVGMFNLFLVIFLLSIMIMVVWTSSAKKGALRVS